MDPPPELATLDLDAIVQHISARKLPPVDTWNPPYRGHSGIRIARDGTWFHDGGPITRKEMVRLFSTVLRREPDGRHVLVTPAERLDIDVEDAPFQAVEMRSQGEGRGREIAFALDTGDIVLLDAEHRLIMRGDDKGPRPYLQVRGGMEARIARGVYYELAAIAIAEDADRPGVWSHGHFFSLATDDSAHAAA